MTRQERYDVDSLDLVVWIFAVLLGLGALGLGYKQCEAQTSPGSALVNAREWVTKVYGEGALAPARLDCVDVDSDGDGYISCALIPPGETLPIGIECATGFYVTGCGNTGCRVAGAR
jgi:hypothetical protein